MGTVYEAEKVVFDEIGPELEALKKKISDLMKNTTDKKWVTALGSAYTALSNLDRNLSQADAKLGVIPMKESEVNESHFKVGDKVKCVDSGKTGEVISLDKEDGAEDEKYYTVNVDGDKMKFAPNELTKESTVNEASVQVAGKTKPSGAQVLATVIIDHLMKNEYLKPGADKVRKELISDVQNVIMDSTF
jgi:hypothetical protein